MSELLAEEFQRDLSSGRLVDSLVPLGSRHGALPTVSKRFCEPLAMALSALGGTDAHLRGTAIEYLSGALPEDILESYLALVGVQYLGGR